MIIFFSLFGIFKNTSKEKREMANAIKDKDVLKCQELIARLKDETQREKTWDILNDVLHWEDGDANLHGVILSYQKDKEEAKDVYQYTLYKFHENLNNGKFQCLAGASIFSYLCNIAKKAIYKLIPKSSGIENAKQLLISQNWATQQELEIFEACRKNKEEEASVQFGLPLDKVKRIKTKVKRKLSELTDRNYSKNSFEDDTKREDSVFYSFPIEVNVDECIKIGIKEALIKSEDAAMFLRQHDKGETTRALAAELGIKENTLTKRFEKLGNELRYIISRKYCPNIDKMERECWFRIKAKRRSTTIVAKKLGITEPQAILHCVRFEEKYGAWHYQQTQKDDI
ncbi:MAG: hypothetical protein ACKVTZ_21860 [Bacteroidia bacterium]